MNTKELEYFKQICIDGSISKAAQNLFITPQGLSKVVKNLENDMGVSLFYRTAQGISLTEYGEEFLVQAETLLKHFNKVASMFREDSLFSKGTLKVASSFGIISYLGINILYDFKEKHQNVNLEVCEYTDYQTEKMVLDEEVNLGFAIGPIDSNLFVSMLIKRYKYYLVIHNSNRLSRKKSITFSDLRNESIIIQSKQFKVYSKFMRYCKAEGFMPKIHFQTTEIALAHKLAHLNKGIAITIYPETENIQYDDVTVVPFEDESFVWDLYMITKANAPISAICDKFQRYIMDLI